MRTQPLVPSSPHHMEHTHCSRHLQQSLLAAATRPISTLGVLRKSSETALHRVRPIKVSEVQGCAHTYMAFSRLKPMPTYAQSHCPAAVRAGFSRRPLGAACPHSRLLDPGLKTCSTLRRFPSHLQVWRAASVPSPIIAAFTARPLLADALCSWLPSRPRSRAGRAVCREREPDRQTLP